MKPVSTAALSLVFVAACAHVKPDDMSTAEHRAAAQDHEQRAQFAEAKYPAPPPSPSKRAAMTPDAPGVPQPLAEAGYERRCAAEHRAAAARLERFEDQACKGLNEEERSACPFLAGLAGGAVIPKGVRLELAPGTNSARLAQRMRCHLAFARAHAFKVDGCPLYRRGVTIRERGPSTIEVLADTEEAARALAGDLRLMVAADGQ